MKVKAELRVLGGNVVTVVVSAWVDAVWDLEFTERKPLDDAVEEELMARGDKAFRKLYHSLLTHAAEHQQQSASIWAILGENRVSVKSLVAVLSFFVLTGKSKSANVQQRVSALHAASVYLLLLGIPGSIANKVFHEVLLDTCSNLTSHCWPQDSGKKRKKDVVKCSQAEGKRSKPTRKGTAEMDVVEADEEEEDEEELHFSGQDLEKIRAAVALLVQSLLRLLQTFPLRDRPQSTSSCTEVMLRNLSLFLRRDIAKLRSVPEMAFYGLQLLCSPKHGDQREVRLRWLIVMETYFYKYHVHVTEVKNIFLIHTVTELKELALPLLHVLLQHICFQMVEKSEYRSHGARAVGMLTSQMTSTDYARFLKWLYSFSRHSKMVCRLFSVDVVMVLLEQEERKPEDCQDLELAVFLPHKFLIQSLLFARRMDESPTVQGHALASLAQCLELSALNKTYRTLPFRTVEISHSDSFICEGEMKLNHVNLLCCVGTVQTETDSNSCVVYAAKENVSLLLRRVKDSKTNIRKSALQALVGLLKHNVIPVSWENLAVVSERCRDQAVSVKKKALQCMGDLLAVNSPVVQKAWLQGVVPAVVDSENSVQDKALEALDQVLLRHVKMYSASHHLDASQRLTWELLGLLCHDCQNLSQYFSRAFTIWSKQNKFTLSFITNLISHTEADHAAGAWLLLSKVVTSSPRLPYGKILDAWDRMVSSKDVSVTTCCHIMSVIGDIAAHLNEDSKIDLMSWLKSFTLSLELISAAVETLYLLGCTLNCSFFQAFLNQHCGELVSVCEAYLASIILNEKGAENLNEDLMIKHLHTLGVASLHCPAKVGKRTVLLVESVLTTHSDKLAGCQDELPASLPLSQFKSNSLPTRVRANGVITLGKLCLQHEDLVQKYLPVFARELEVGTEVAVRNNVVVIMCDLCVRYTNIVDHYIPNISACLRDDKPIIREQTLIMLVNLLQEEFVKWKGSLFFRFMVTLVDPVPAIASLCEYCLVHLLLKKNPEMFSQHFIECIFHFNSYSNHKSYNKFPQTEHEKVRFSLKGAQNREKRFRIYRFLLENFTDTQRFNTTNKINQTILACFADEELPLDTDGAEILSETFNILSLKEMKLQAMSAPADTPAGEEPEEDNMATMAKAVLQAAQKKVVSQVQKKVFIENTVPLIISLKNLLERKHSPVLRDLTAYLQVTMQEYRTEVKEFFSGDEQLAAEVEFALKTAEKEKEMMEQMENCTLKGDPKPPPAQVRNQHAL
uniref:Non-SMC condensin II complex, subunit D3 n=1 Tax=Echeneis naucrates TaxID=173247 RepID=A0A665TIX4_ECHNA